MRKSILPAARVAIAGGAPITREWYAYFQWLQFNLDDDSLRAEVDALDVRVKALEDADHGGDAPKITGTGSIYVNPTDIITISLSGDIAEASPTMYYGSNGDGDKGWYAVADAFADTANIEKSVADDGVVSFELTDLSDSGAGTLQAITRDAKGRITGTRAATITGTAGNITVAHGDASDGLPTIDLADVTVTAGGALQKLAFDAKGRLNKQDDATTTDLPEGDNLYYTDVRADARVDAGIEALKAETDPFPQYTTDAEAAAAAPVQSVNGATGDVMLNASDVGAATAAQGVLADSAVQRAGDTMTGNLANAWAGTSATNVPTITVSNTATTGTTQTESHIDLLSDSLLGRFFWRKYSTPVFGWYCDLGDEGGGLTRLRFNGAWSFENCSDVTILGNSVWHAGNFNAAARGITTNLAVTDWNTYATAAGVYFPTSTNAATNGPGGNYYSGVRVFRTAAGSGGEIVSRESAGSPELWFRGWSGGSTSAWKRAIAVDDIVSGRLTLSSGTSNPLELITSSASPWAITLTRSDLGFSSSAYVRDASYGWEFQHTITTRGNVMPRNDNSSTCGTSSQRWSVVYAATGSINTSDGREKTPVTPMTPAELAAAADMARAIGTYQWLGSIAEKGEESARHHAGLTVQRAIEIMQAHGLDPMRYGFICYDEWDAEPAVIDPQTGDEIEPAREAGNRYSFRHDELLLFLARGFAARLDALESAQ